MADYIDPNIAFVLQASLEHNVWPFDPRDLFTTMRYRLDWESIMLLTGGVMHWPFENHARYAAMGRPHRWRCAISVDWTWYGPDFPRRFWCRRRKPKFPLTHGGA